MSTLESRFFVEWNCLNVLSVEISGTYSRAPEEKPSLLEFVLITVENIPLDISFSPCSIYLIIRKRQIIRLLFERLVQKHLEQLSKVEYIQIICFGNLNNKVGNAAWFSAPPKWHWSQRNYSSHLYQKPMGEKALLPSRYQDTDLIYTYKGYDKPTRLYVTD